MDRYRILSLDGGGSWALIQVKALIELFGPDKPVEKFSRISIWLLRTRVEALSWDASLKI
jgi:hypothetical protein